MTGEPSTSRAAAALERLLALMQALRDPKTGCSWDREQTHESLSRYAIEEAYETEDAIASGDRGKLRDELGDLLFQVVLHAQLGSEAGTFDFAAIADGIHDKLVSRHPHVFKRESTSETRWTLESWEALKARERQERAESDQSALADIPVAAPALSRATKLGRRAAAVGFDWDTADGAREKIEEELLEVEHAIAAAGGQPSDHVFEEFGDLLFTVAHWARHLGVDAEAALRFGNAKFERRFRAMEAIAAAQQKRLKSMSLESLEALWTRAKAEEGAPSVQPAFIEPASD